ncbi:hypothetical protein MNBD_GAMMA08-1792 [hydrothermal vent metagenome]|uniref:Lipoprotein n=1 Tax=hydrothermal vent metagenome TaxID=652676 RepID=A0A3B0XXE4_9ZZZZ
MKKLTLYLFIFVFNFFVIGCDFDEQRQRNIEFPVTLEIKNELQETIFVKSIYNSVNVEAGFLLNGSEVLSNQTFKLQVSQENFKAISSGEYFLEVSCEDNSSRTVSGKQLKTQVVHNVQEWKVIVLIEKKIICQN